MFSIVITGVRSPQRLCSVLKQVVLDWNHGQAYEINRKPH